MDPIAIQELVAKAQDMYQRLIKQENSTEAFIKSIHKSANWKNPKLYKTTICTHWRDNGKCKFGVKCWYAHGMEELRTPPSGTPSQKSMEHLSSTGSLPPILDADRASVYRFNDEAQRYPSVQPSIDPYLDMSKYYNGNNGITVNQEGGRPFGFNNQMSGNSYSTGYFSNASSVVDSLSYQRNLSNQMNESLCFDSKPEQPIISNNPQNIWSYASVDGRKQEMFANDASLRPQNVPSMHKPQVPFGQSFRLFGDSYPLQGNSFPCLSSLNQNSFNPASGAMPNVKLNLS